MEDNRDKRLLFIAPSHTIKNQMYEYIIKYLSTEETDKEISSREQIKGKKLSVKEKVKIILPNFEATLYQTMISKSKMTQEVLDKLEPDFVICDEAHHIKRKKQEEGIEKSEEEIQKEIQEEANVWGTAMASFIEKNPQAKILGITATPERSDGVNIAVDFFEGNIASEISLIEALTREDIPIKVPDYVSCVYTMMDEINEESIQEQIEKYKSSDPEKAEELQAKLDRIRKIADSGKGIPDLFTEHLGTEEAKALGRDKGRYIVFCDSIEDMQEKMKGAKEWFAGVDSEPEIYSVSSKQKNNNSQISAFEQSSSDHIKLLFSVDMLNEGLHVEDISGVIMSRKTDSRNIYLQQLGRAISSDPDRAKPIVFDLANNYLTYNIYEELKSRKINSRGNKSGTTYIGEDDDISLDKDDDLFAVFRISGIMEDLVDLLDVGEQGRDANQEVIEKLQKLDAIGIDCSSIKSRDTIETLVKRLIKEGKIEEKKIEKSKLEELGLDFRIGNRVNGFKGRFRGTEEGRKPTEEQVEIAKSLGISFEKKKIKGKDIGMASYKAPADKCDEASEVLQTAILRNETQQEQPAPQ
mgnify:CR=1 FL=1